MKIQVVLREDAGEIPGISLVLWQGVGIKPVRNLGKYRGMIGEKPFFTVKKPSPMLASPIEPCYSIYR